MAIAAAAANKRKAKAKVVVLVVVVDAVCELCGKEVLNPPRWSGADAHFVSSKSLGNGDRFTLGRRNTLVTGRFHV